VPGITGIGSLSPLLGVKIVYLVDRSDLFKISNFVYDGREILRSLYSSLQGQTFYGGYSELAGSLFVGVKIVYLVDWSDLFKISNFVYDGREIEGQGQTFYGEYSELAGSLFVIVKTDNLGNFWNN
jgi:hypothetical protein